MRDTPPRHCHQSIPVALRGAHPSSYVHQVIRGLRQGQLAALGNKKREASSPGQQRPQATPVSQARALGAQGSGDHVPTSGTDQTVTPTVSNPGHGSVSRCQKPESPSCDQHKDMRPQRGQTCCCPKIWNKKLGLLVHPHITLPLAAPKPRGHTWPPDTPLQVPHPELLAWVSPDPVGPTLSAFFPVSGQPF